MECIGDIKQRLFAKQISSVVKISIYQLRMLTKFKHLLNLNRDIPCFYEFTVGMLCAPASASLPSRLQLMQNTAARFFNNSKST